MPILFWTMLQGHQGILPGSLFADSEGGPRVWLFTGTGLQTPPHGNGLIKP